MRVLSLNIWGGCLKKPLLEFVARQADVDILCFQEVYHGAKERISTDATPFTLEIFSAIEEQLPDHNGYFRPVVNGIYGLGSFVHKSIEVAEEGVIWIHDNPDYTGRGPTHSRIMQWLRIGGQHPLTIGNVHGLWNGQGKGDSPSRLVQSERIRQYVDQVDVPVILVGDFNLSLETVSLQMLEERLENLIRRFKITSTRTALYAKKERMADYCLVSPAVRVNEFAVLDVEVSDHKPLVIDFTPC